MTDNSLRIENKYLVHQITSVPVLASSTCSTEDDDGGCWVGGGGRISNVVSRREYTSKPGLIAWIRDSVEIQKRINEAVAKKEEKAEKELATKTIVESNLYAL
jgi:hypothetical protein